MMVRSHGNATRARQTAKRVFFDVYIVLVEHRLYSFGFFDVYKINIFTDPDTILYNFMSFYAILYNFLHALIMRH